MDDEGIWGVKESWTKLFSFQQLTSMGHFTVLTPLAYSKDRDKVLLKVNCQKFVWYDLEKKILRSVKIKNHDPNVFVVKIYVGSLVPPSGGGGGGDGLHGMKPPKQEERKKRKKKGRTAKSHFKYFTIYIVSIITIVYANKILILQWT